MDGRLRGKAIMVIGAATGIGAATAYRLAGEGARVCVADINFGTAELVAANAGGGAFAVEIDIVDAPSVKRAFAAAVGEFGKLDGVHVNAADLSVIFKDSDALDVDLEIFDRTIAVNLRGHLLCTREAIPHLRAAGGGAMLYTSSDASISGEAQRPSYAVSKSGIDALMRHVASRWGGEGITANCVAPGFVMTPEMIAGGRVPEAWIAKCLADTPSPRLGRVEDVAGVAAMLLSDDGRWVNGQVIHVNGGALFR